MSTIVSESTIHKVHLRLLELSRIEDLTITRWNLAHGLNFSESTITECVKILCENGVPILINPYRKPYGYRIATCESDYEKYMMLLDFREQSLVGSLKRAEREYQNLADNTGNKEAHIKSKVTKALVQLYEDLR